MRPEPHFTVVLIEIGACRFSDVTFLTARVVRASSTAINCDQPNLPLMKSFISTHTAHDAASEARRVRDVLAFRRARIRMNASTASVRYARACSGLFLACL